jgi:hypothetical protein
MDAHVRELRVSISGVAERDRGDWFARQVLARFCQIVEDRFPGQDISIGRVDLRCALSVGQLTDRGEVLRCAGELAASIDEGLYAVFSNEVLGADDGVVHSVRSASEPFAEWGGSGSGRSQESAVAGPVESSAPARSRQEDDRWLVAGKSDASATGVQDRDAATMPQAAVAWLISCLRVGTMEAWIDPPGILPAKAKSLPALERRLILIAALLRLHAAGEMFDVLVRMTPASMAFLLKTLELESLARVLARTRTPDEAGFAEADAGWAILAADAAAGATARVAAWLPQIPPILPPNAAVVAAFVLAQAELRAVGSPLSSMAMKEAGRETEPKRSNSRRSDNLLEYETSPGDESSPRTDMAITTEFGGLFYLLALVLELGWGETLWKACLPEGQLLAKAASCILGEEAAGDVAASLFGGVTRAEAACVPAISAAQRDAVCDEMLARLVAVFPRTGIGHMPIPVLDVAASPGGRLLVASLGFPAAIFAWPAPDAASVTSGIETFLRHWPLTAEAPMARGALSDFDRSGRLRGASGSPRAVALMPAGGADTAATSVLTQLCGGVLSLLYARLMAQDAPDIADPAGLVARYLAVPGRIALAPETMTILLPMDRIDIALRRAGLDRNPGWVPWLRRTVRIEFEPNGPDEVQ